MKEALLEGLFNLQKELTKAEQTIQVRGAIVHCNNLIGEVASIKEDSFDATPIAEKPKTKSESEKKAEEVKVVATEIVSPELKVK